MHSKSLIFKVLMQKKKFAISPGVVLCYVCTPYPSWEKSFVPIIDNDEVYDFAFQSRCDNSCCYLFHPQPQFIGSMHEHVYSAA